VRRGRGGSPQFPGQPSARSTPTTPEGPSASASGSQTPSMAFAVMESARHPHVPARRQVPFDDACSGFAHAADRDSRSAPLRTRPLDHARGLHYQGPGHLPGPDSHRLAALNLSLDYVMTTTSSRRPSCWAHSTKAGELHRLNDDGSIRPAGCDPGPAQSTRATSIDRPARQAPVLATALTPPNSRTFPRHPPREAAECVYLRPSGDAQIELARGRRGHRGSRQLTSPHARKCALTG
jgi:hypothetical protein